MGMASLNIDILGMKFSNPIFTAAGPGAKDGELCVKAVQGGAGGIVTKTKYRVMVRVTKRTMGSERV